MQLSCVTGDANGSSSGGEGGSSELLPPLSLDGVVAVVRRCRGEGGGEGGGVEWALGETPLESYVKERRREVAGTSPAYQQALSTTSLHTIQWR